MNFYNEIDAYVARWLDNLIDARVGQIRAYGNAIVPQVAAAFILSFLEAESDMVSSTLWP